MTSFIDSTGKVRQVGGGKGKFQAQCLAMPAPQLSGSGVHIHNHYYGAEGEGFLDSLRNAFDPNRNGLTNSINHTGQEFKQFGQQAKSGLQKTGDVLKQVAQNPVVQQLGKQALTTALNAGVDTFAPELAPVAAPLISAGVNAIPTSGSGLKKGRFPKGSEQAKAFMKSLRDKRKKK